MLLINSKNSEILLTSPDYPPKIGGLSTFTKSIENSLKRINLEYDLFVWEDIKTLKKTKKFQKKYRFIINVHFYVSFYLKDLGYQHINFIHGSEITMSSPNLLKNILKKLLKKNFYKALERSHFNIFISQATQNIIVDNGYKLNYSRDFIFPNCIELKNHFFYKKKFSDKTIKLICLARDVPHKNIEASLDCAEALAQVTKKDVILYVTKNLPSRPFVTCVNVSDVNNLERDKILAESHFNLLFSLDHSSKGFVEGFGLTVIEAGIMGTPSIVSCFGGLPESCHSNDTGWVVNPTKENFIKLFQQIDEESYSIKSKNCYDHNCNYHSSRNYDDLFKVLLQLWGNS